MATKVLFDCCVIARNEIKTLPKLRASLEPFFAAGGQCNLLDTGSTDGTATLARRLGFNVKEVGGMFLKPVENPQEINERFIVEGEPPIVKEGDKYFSFAEARNCCAEMARENVCFWYDADEVSVAMDIDAINKSIEDGYTQWEYFFTFAYDNFGNEAVKFIQCKAYDRRVMKWDGRIHELVICIDNAVGGKRIFLDEKKYKLAHHQNQESGRHSYSIGLAVDCFEFPANDRHKHYCARELYWNQRPKSALKMFKEHIAMGGWAAERAESYLFAGDIEGQLGRPDEQVRNYNEAFYIDSGRNKALVSLSLFYRHNKNYQAAICYAKAALEIPCNGFYADNLSYYRELPHEILYQCYGFMGNVEAAKFHIEKCLEFQPYNRMYERDTNFYFEFGVPEIDGWMRWKETQFLYYEAKKHDVIVEVGSWKGRSTTCICSGNKDAKVFAVDTWQGSQDERDSTNLLAKQEDIFKIFTNNTKQFANLTAIRKTSVEAAKDFEDKSISWVFVDAGHTKEEVVEDILAWLPKVKDDGIISGHDHQESWMGVIAAVKEVFNGPDYVVDSIWVVDLSKRGKVELPQPTTTQIPRKIYTAWLGDPMPELVQKCIESQKKMCAEFGYEHYVLTLENIPIRVQYIADAINSSHPNGVKYCKATDYMRFYLLHKYGGIFLDSDCEIISGKSFDAMLNDEMFIGLETADWANGKVVLGTAVMGSKAGHPFLKWILNEMETKFSGGDNLNYESSMQLLNEGGVNFQDQFTLYNPDFFYPFEWLQTGETKVTENTICLHHFMKLWTPETNKKSTLQQFKYNIENNINFTFVKRGDGELACMNGEEGGNCDGHPYTKELGDKLKDAYEYLEGKATIVEFDDQGNYNVLLHRTDSNLKEVSEFYKAIAESDMKKIFVAPKRLSEMAAILNAEHIVIPEINSFESYTEIFFNIPIQIGGIYIFCAGMPAKPMIADLMKQNPQATYLDCGSAFDPIVGGTRTFQITKDEFLSLYKPEPVDNFKLPQDTHPERLFTLANIRDSDGKVIYDLGCSTNKTLQPAIGVDIRAVSDIQCSIDDLPFEDNSGDVVISRHSTEHLLDPVRALKEWIRVLKPGGKMIIVLPDHEFINTIDPYYSNGEHLHAYTRESFNNLISLFPELHIAKQETVLKDWSFGTVIYKLPKISFVLPQLGREEGLKKCLQSIEDLDYPEHLKEIIVIEGQETVPEKVAEGLKQSTGEFICYCANDMFFFPDTIRTAVGESLELNKGLVSFNEGELLPDKGNICTHFVIRKSLIEKLENGEIFSKSMSHVGVDNFLVFQAEKINEFHYSEKAKIVHNHFSKGGTFDEIYQKGWSKVDEDRNVLKKKLLKLNGEY